MNKLDQTGPGPIARTQSVAMRSELGKGYDNPKHWEDHANKGDIFQITKADADNNPEYVEGDFLIALNDGSSSYYPARGTSNKDWKYAWSKTANFSLILETGTNAGSIYGNGLNQIGVQVHFSASDDNGVAVPLSSQVVRHAVQLLDYTSGQDLPSGWNTAFELNQYHTLPTGQPMRLNRLALLQSGELVAPAQGIQYVTCAADARSRVLTVGAKITTSTGKFYTSTYDGDVHSSVVIKALEPKILRSADLDIKWEKTATGTSYGVWAIPDGYQFAGCDRPNWTQYDYFITPKDTSIEFVDIVTRDTYQVDGPSKGWWSTHRNNDGQLDMFFLWGASTQGEKKKVGDEDYTSDGYGLDLCADITLPSRKNAVCATQLDFRPKYEIAMYKDGGFYYETVPWSISQWYTPTFTVYDIYGNASTIGVRTSSDNTAMEIFNV